MKEAKQIPQRQEINPEDKWAIEDLYASDKEWQKSYDYLKKEVLSFGKYEGTLNKSAGHLLSYLKANDELSKGLENVYVYASQKSHEDTANDQYQNLSSLASAIATEISAATAFAVPEILEISWDKISTFIKEEEKLLTYETYLKELFKKKEHILSAPLEKLLADVDDVAQCPQDIYSMFNNADIKFPDIKDADGNIVTLTHGRFIPFMEGSDRSVRKDAFMAVYNTYGNFKNTLAATFVANLKQEYFFAKARGYKSSLHMALDGSHVPMEVYTNLIKTVHENLHLMHEYVKLRKEKLGLEELHMYDLYTPIVEKVSKSYSFKEAKELVIEGLKPLGDEYAKVLQEGFDNRWIDIYENQGKRSGAYSWGAYGTHPYVLLNYQGSLNHVFTLAHEMGHAIHSYYSDQGQPYIYAGYKIFVAEVASTCNEALLMQHLLTITTDKDVKEYLINYFMEQFRTTLYRQVMFAEFEQITHEMNQEGKSLTAKELSRIYYDLNVLYYGKDIVVDEEIAMEWARIPHFYTPFYVYQYATGYSAAIAISTKILEGDKEVIEGYFKFLSGGSSMYPTDLLKLCGVDMTKPAPVESALKVFESLLKQMKEF